MRKNLCVLLTVFLTMVFLAGCSDSTPEPVTLDDKYYNSSEFISATAPELNDLMDSGASFVVYTHNDNCTIGIQLKDNLTRYMNKYQISAYTTPFSELKQTSIHDEVEYAPSAIVISKGKVVAYLDAEDDDDLEYFKKYDKLAEWMNIYVVTKQE